MLTRVSPGFGAIRYSNNSWVKLAFRQSTEAHTKTRMRNYRAALGIGRYLEIPVGSQSPHVNQGTKDPGRQFP